MNVSVFNDPAAAKRARTTNRNRVRSKMRTSTIREFGGGWNEIDAPVGLSTKYASVLKNWYRKADGSQSIRYGTKVFCFIGLTQSLHYPLGTRRVTVAGTEAVGDAVVNGKSFGFKFQAAHTSPSIEVTIEVAVVTVGGTFTAAVYTDVAGSPSAIIGTASPAVVISTPNIYKFVPVPGTNLTNGTSYWVVFTETTTTGNFTVNVVANQGGSIASGKRDVITTIADNQLTASADLQCLVNQLDYPTDRNIKNIHYLDGNIITVAKVGDVYSVDSDGVDSVIFDDGIAASLAGAPSDWSSGFDHCSFAEIKGSLTIHNGMDKPLEVYDNSGTPAVRYLQDLATGSNVNTPIGKYAATVSDYLCVAGIADEAATVYIGAKGTVGTFQGDPIPNDAVSLDLGAYAPEDSKEIRGLSSFRNYLFVHFLSATLQVILGEYDDTGTHIPRVNDTLQKFGLLSYRANIPVVNDLIFPDITGVNTIKRNVLSGEVEPDRLSELIAPAYQNTVAALTQEQMDRLIFGVHDRLAGHYMLCVPTDTTEIDSRCRTFVFTFNERMKVKAWSEFNGWGWQAACSSALGRVFFAQFTGIYQYGNEAFSEEYSGDFIDYWDYEWANNTPFIVDDRVIDPDDNSVWVCLIPHTSAVAGTFAADRTARPTLWEEYEGENINFDWELPWTDAGTRSRVKRLAFLHFDTQGNSQFDVDVFVDNIYKDENDNYDPALTLNYTGGESFGYGGGDQPYGGGRNTRDERLWSHPVKFRLAKIRFHGATKLPLRVISITELYALGRYGR